VVRRLDADGLPVRGRATRIAALRYIKDPETGKRVSRPNPESEWILLSDDPSRTVH
jgi:hypothetical protein